MENKKWKDLLIRYIKVKEMFIICEELDPELDTNLQPMNEFRALLDHVMRLISIELENKDEEKFLSEYDKAKSHLRRAFFDICDLTSMHYRNKIITLLEDYSHDEIRAVIPEYYEKWRSRINEINFEIADLRNNKGTKTDNEYEAFDKYSEIIDELKTIFFKINAASASLEKIHNDKDKL